MDDQRWHEVKGIVAEALDRAPAERQMFIDEACGDDTALRAQVGKLLRLEGKADAWFGAPTASVAGPAATAEVARQIGRYEIRGVIAAGGMGTVYEAVQDHPHRLVALKLLRRGAASPQAMRRFHHEAEILGRLRHPNIAHVHDAGTFDDGEGAQPYFVMELVKGEPLMRYADSRKVGTRQRMELFVKVCDAVQYAHQRGVIHRDLKPDNIIVDDLGEPKILDFGVARATDADIRATTLRTDVGQLIGTVPYMSPEQVTGDPTELDTRSDVYSLGVVLYELMSGRLPHDLRGKTIPEAVRVIREDDPTPLSSIDRVFRGDVETIVTKALAKEKDRRYQTAADLASDVRRYLRDEPIVARPASTFYQLRKFARRNRALVGGAAAAATALVLGTALASWQAVQATRARDQAVDVNTFLFEVLGATDFVEEGHRLEVVDVLDRAVDAIPTTFADRPLLEAEVRHRLGISYASMSAFDKGLAQLRTAREIRTRELGPEHRVTLETTATLAEVLSRTYQWYESEQLWREVVDVQERTLGKDHPDTLRSMGQLSRPLVNLYKVDEAVELSQRSANGLLKVLGEDDEDAIYAYLWSWSPLYSQGRYDELQEVLENAVEMAERALPEDHHVRLLAEMWLGEWLCMRGHWDEGWPILEGALTAQQRLYPGDDLRTLKWLDEVGSQMVNNGPDPETRQEGLRMVRQAAEGMARLFGDDHIHTGYALEHLATAQRAMGMPEAAEGNYRKALAIKRAYLGDDHPHISNTLIRLGWTLVELNRLGEGEELLREGLKRNLKLIAGLPDSPVTKAHRDTIFALASLAGMLERQGRMADAEIEWRRAVAIWERGGDPGYRQQELRLGINLAAQGRYDEAEEIYRRVVAWRKSELGEAHSATLLAANHLAFFLTKSGEPDKLAEAEALARETVGHARVTFSERNETLYEMVDTLAVALHRRGKNEEAVLLFEQVAAAAPGKLSPVHYGRCLTALRRYEEAEKVLLEVDGTATAPAREALADLYDAWGKPEKAAEYRGPLPAPRE